MTDFFCTRSNWLLNVPKLQGFDVLTIHPRDGLTVRMIIEAMAAQKILYDRPGQPAFRIVDHGTKVFIQRNMDVLKRPKHDRS
jgi:hypothetical protein